MTRILALVIAAIAIQCGSARVALAGDSTTAERVGDVLVVATTAGAYLATFAMDDPRGRPQFYKGLFLNLGTTYVLKLAIDKPRPDQSGTDSFPSAHTSVAFQGASFVQLRYGWRYGIPAYAAATVVGWSRVAADKHHRIDVLAGAAIGVLSSYLFTEPFDGVAVEPLAEGGVYGARLAVTW